MKLSLTAKTLVLVAIPLLIESGLAIYFIYLKQEAEREAKLAIQARDISDRVNRLTGDIFETWKVASRTKRDEWLTKGYLRETISNYLGRLKAQYVILDQLTADKPELRQEIARSFASINEAESILKQALEAVESGNSARAFAIYMTKRTRLEQLFTGLIAQELQLVARYEEEFARESDRKESRLRERYDQIAVVALVGNVIFTLLLAFFFLRNVALRLALVSNNIRLYSDKKPLAPVLSGHDEIAQMDKVFRQMVSSIELSNQTKQEFVGMLTHDLRSPLSMVQGFVELAQIGNLGGLNERGVMLAAGAQRNCALMMSQINSLLDIYKIEEGRLQLAPTAVPVHELWTEIKEHTEGWLAENSVALKITDSDLKVLADREKVVQVLYNLIFNAYKYSPEHSSIQIACVQKDNFAEITVTDQGPGIPPEKRDSVFERFVQLDGSAKGSGLGLTICARLVQLHGGQIWVTGPESGGSCFHFTLPLA